MPRPRERSTLLKSVPRAPGRDRARQGDRSRPDRGLVRGRGPDRAEEQDHPALGTTGNAAFGAARSAHRFHLHLRGYLPRRWQGSRARPARLQHRGDEPAPRRNRRRSGSRQARRTRRRPGRMGPLGRPRASRQHYARRAPAQIPRTQPCGAPPKAAELAPAENVWQFMRDNWLSNRVFASYTDLVDHCCEAWNKLIERPWTIMSIGLRDWANGF